ncbi:hypothetical protein [Mesorhizobium qingshengii]|uniref:Transmembrane protein n=1 Tax=Mesorhizobium qingshengii TaxID=1165689 RepID=A0A1G5ZQB9_9HYPH|nr:hypothetical protein [Mesorhizobium qingshengii]SDA97004.1 hypothetical protein SAMN02927914_05778 [Mesorhizobium qingshengii]
MSRIELIGGLVGVVVAVLGLVDSFHGFLAAGLTLKLFVLGIAGIISIALLTSRLMSRPRPRNILSGAAKLLLVCGAFVVVALLLATRSPIMLREEITKGKSVTTLAAAYSSANAVTIQLPPHVTTNCMWSDAEPGAFPRLDAQMVDWDSPVPKLHIDNFVHPQRVAVECSPPSPLRGITVDPPLTEMFLRRQVDRWVDWILSLGGLTWLAACCRLWVS